MDGAADDFYRGYRAEMRSIELLRSWLSPGQLRQFDTERWFVVHGGETGRRYRVTYPSAPYNVHELNCNDEVVLRLCFIPKDVVPPGDVMLAQKISLEYDELDTRAIANRLPG